MLIRAAIVAVLVAGTHFVVVRSSSQHDSVTHRTRLDAFPRQVGAWSSIGDVPLDAKTLSVLGADDYLNRPYRTAVDPDVDLYIGYYDRQQQSSSIHSPLNCLPGSGWQIVAHDTVSVGDSHAVINRMRVRNEVSQLVVFYWYQSHGRVLASEYWSKAYLALDAVRLRRTDGALVRVTTPVLEWDGNGDRTAERRALRFVEDIVPLLAPFIPS